MRPFGEAVYRVNHEGAFNLGPNARTHTRVHTGHTHARANTYRNFKHQSEFKLKESPSCLNVEPTRRRAGSENKAAPCSTLNMIS